MNREEELAQEVARMRQLAQENKGVDLNALAMNVMSRNTGQFVSARAKRWAYLISLAVPPFGLIFAAKYFLSSESDAKIVAWICVALTIFSIALTWLTFSLMLSGTDLSQIQQIDPRDLQELIQ